MNSPCWVTCRRLNPQRDKWRASEVKLWVILQDLSQLKHHYKDSWETFFGNAALATFHGIADMTTLEYLIKALGGHTIVHGRNSHWYWYQCASSRRGFVKRDRKSGAAIGDA